MKKRLLVLLLAVSMLLCLCSCQTDKSAYGQLRDWTDATVVMQNSTTGLQAYAQTQEDNICILSQYYLAESTAYQLMTYLTPDTCEFEMDFVYSGSVVAYCIGSVDPASFGEGSAVTVEQFEAYNGTIERSTITEYTAGLLYDTLSLFNDYAEEKIGVTLGDVGYSAFASSESTDYSTVFPKGFSMDRVAFAGQVTLLGLGMVFAVLALLWGILEIFRIVMCKPAKPKDALAADVAAEEQKEASDVAAVAAAISAAVAVYLESENLPAEHFRVVSFKRSGKNSAWNQK